MMKIIASLVILGLCANVAFAAGAAPVSSTQSSAFTASLLNSTIYTVYSASNTTDAAVFDSSAAVNGATAAVQAGVINSLVWFVPGTSNDTSYVFGVPSSGYASVANAPGTNPGWSSGSGPTVYTTGALKKRSINNTIVGWANDTKEFAVIGDSSISTTILGAPSQAASAVAPGYLALLTASVDSSTATTAVNWQIYFTLITGSSGSVTSTKVTSTADVAVGVATTTGCTVTTVGTGNVWYDIGAGAFFFTYWVNVVTQTAPASGSTACTGSASSTATKIYLGGYYLNGTSVLTPIAASAGGTGGNTISSLIGGGDNWLNSSNIYIAYQDSTASPTVVYYSKTTKSTTATALGSFGTLIKSTTSGTNPVVNMNYKPVSVWASNYTYAITVGNETDSTPSASGSTTTYTIGFVNFLNGTSTGVDSGLSSSGSNSYGAFWGWPLSTGYSVLAGFVSATSPYPTSYIFGTYYGNGTANTTAATLGSLTYGAPQIYEDVNGTMWLAWTDEDTANTVSPGGALTYAGYLAKLQGQINVVSGASVLSAISAFFALFLAAIFVF